MMRVDVMAERKERWRRACLPAPPAKNCGCHPSARALSTTGSPLAL